jgi:hypothetical protein
MRRREIRKYPCISLLHSRGRSHVRLYQTGDRESTAPESVSAAMKEMKQAHSFDRSAYEERGNKEGEGC